MKEISSDFLVKRRRQWGVRRIFGYPGDGINGIIGALESAKKNSETKIEFIQARHEKMSAFKACGHTKFTGEVGRCLATTGPGAILAAGDGRPLPAASGLCCAVQRGR